MVIENENENGCEIGKGQEWKASDCGQGVGVLRGCSLGIGWMIRLWVVVMLCCMASGTQIQIINTPTQQNIKALYLMKSLRRFRIRYINLLNNTYSCITAIKQKPLSLSTTPKPLTLHQTGTPLPSPTPDPSLYPNNLNLLEDPIGITHTTKQFIYGYRHKRVVSQFDDQRTVMANQKKEVENFTMGVYRVQMLADGGQGQGQERGKEVKVDMKPHSYENDGERAKIPEGVNLFAHVDKPLGMRYAHEAAKLAYIDHRHQLITLTHPLEPTPHLISKTYNLTLSCSQPNTSPPHSYPHTLIALSLTPFQLRTYTPIPSHCRSLTSIARVDRWLSNFYPGINAIGDLLVGDLDAFCGDGVGGVKGRGTVGEGDFVMVETERSVDYRVRSQGKGLGMGRKRNYQVGEGVMDYMEIQIDPETGEAIIMTADDDEEELRPVGNKLRTIQQFFLLKIQKIIGQNLYALSTTLPIGLKPKKCHKLSLPESRTISYSGQLKAGNKQVTKQFQIPNPQAQKLITLDLLRFSLVRRPEDGQGMDFGPGAEFFCVIEERFVITPDSLYLEEFGMTLGKGFGEFIQVHLWGGVSRLIMYQEIAEFSKTIKCTPYLPKSQAHNEKEQDQQRFYTSPTSEIIKLSSRSKSKIKFGNPSQKDNSQPVAVGTKKNVQEFNQNSILMVTLSKDAVVQIQTTVYQEDEESQDEEMSGLEEDVTPAYDLQQPSNPNPAAKKQIGHNKYFANSQKIYKVQTTFFNGSKIRVERLQNSFYENSTNQNMIIIYKGIWRAGDFVKFPRFVFKGGERITGVVVKFGTVFIRAVNLSKVDPEIYVVSSTEFRKHEGYGPMQRPRNTTSTQSRFKWGTFCGGQINKNREVVIKLKCGEPWLKIKSVTETSPCQYEIQILTQYLCDKSVIFPALSQGFSTFNGSMCLPSAFYQAM